MSGRGGPAAAAPPRVGVATCPVLGCAARAPARGLGRSLTARPGSAAPDSRFHADTAWPVAIDVQLSANGTGV
jgi:hypothetical protein